MLTLQSPTDLQQYCLRNLGSPVINVEVEASQLTDRINDAIEYFIERHFDGVTEAFYKISIKEADVVNGYVTAPHEIVVITDVIESNTGASIEIMDDFEFNAMDTMNRTGNYDVLDYYLTMSHLNMVKSIFVRSKQFTHNNATNKITPQYKLSSKGSANLLENPQDISVADDWTHINSTLTGNDFAILNGDMIADTVESNASGTFGFTQTVSTDSVVRGLYTLKTSILLGSYAGDIKLSIHDANGTLVSTQTFTDVANNKWLPIWIEGTFDTTHVQDLKITVEGTALAGGETFMLSGITLYRNAMLLLHGYTAIDPEESVDVYNDRWMKKYSTQLVKKQWGTNLKKYTGVAMSGSVEVNGQAIYDEAVEDIRMLEEEFSMNFELPTDFMIS